MGDANAGGTNSYGDEMDRPRVGLICNEQHAVFSEVAARLERLDVETTFFEPGRPLGEADLSGLSLLLNKKVDPESFRALALAESTGLPTWNGFVPLLLGIRPLGDWALDRVGFRVPPGSFEKPSGDHVAKTLVDFHSQPDPLLNGDGEWYQVHVPAPAIDYKYYAVATGSTIEVRVLKTTSKLHGEKRPLELVAPDPDLADKLRRLVTMTDAQALGVDLVVAEGQYWAVDVNPAPSFRHTGMEDELVASVLARLVATPDRFETEVPESLREIVERS
jgi:hypothetical protein